jgi:choline kinase
MDDEMKVVVNEKNHLTSISKILPRFKGAYIGTTRVPTSCAKDYWRAFDYVRKSHDPRTACVENILDYLATDGSKILVSWVNNVSWFEVDTPEDLTLAREGLVS